MLADTDKATLPSPPTAPTEGPRRSLLGKRIAVNIASILTGLAVFAAIFVVGATTVMLIAMGYVWGQAENPAQIEIIGRHASIWIAIALPPVIAIASYAATRTYGAALKLKRLRGK